MNMYVTWQEGIKVVDRVKLLINFEITLKWEDYSRLSGSAQCNDKGPSK